MGGHAIDPSLQGRVPERTFLVVIWVFWSLAIITLAFRIAVRIRTHKRLLVDDYLLLFATACLTAGTGFMQARYADAYKIIALAIDPFKAGIPSDLNGTIYRSQLIIHVFGPLLWTAIFSAKFSYLWFFRQLVFRIRPLMIWWWVVVVVTACVYPISIASVFIACPYMDIRAIKCASQPMIGRAFDIAIASMVLDIMTDLLIVSIPVCLLWKVKIRPTQKLGLAGFLCLSIIILVMTIIRVSPLRIGPHGNNIAHYSVWVNMVGQVEACVAVCFVSLTAFRFLFISHERRRSDDQGNKKPWYTSTIEKIRRQRRQSDEEQQRQNALPQIPSATLTGVRTFINNRFRTNKTTTNMMDSTTETIASDELPIYMINEKEKTFLHSASSASSSSSPPQSQLQSQSHKPSHLQSIESQTSTEIGIEEEEEQKLSPRTEVSSRDGNNTNNRKSSFTEHLSVQDGGNGDQHPNRRV